MRGDGFRVPCQEEKRGRNGKVYMTIEDGCHAGVSRKGKSQLVGKGIEQCVARRLESDAHAPPANLVSKRYCSIFPFPKC